MAQGSSKAGGCGCAADQAAALQRRTLWVVVLINPAMFVVELVFGLRAGSTGLIADSLDMLVDAGVYGLSLAAVGRSPGEQRQAAMLSGRLQIVLAIWVLLDVLRRTSLGSEPISALLVQLYAKHLVTEGEIPPAPAAKGFGGGAKPSAAAAGEVKAPVWLGKDYQLQRQPAGEAGITKGSWQRGHWRPLSPLAAPVAAPLEWVEPVLVG
jgi:hypothetical protein